MTRVMITGLGAVTPVGNDVPAMWQSLIEGRSGAGPITAFDASELETRIAAQVKDFDASLWMNRKEARRMDRFTQFALAAGAQALADSQLHITPENAPRIGVVIGSAVGGITTLLAEAETLRAKGPSRVSPFLIPMMLSDTAAGQVAIQFGLRGPNLCTASACASGAHAIGEACEMIRRGGADAVLAGGSEAGLVPLGVAGFNALGALSKRNGAPHKASRPFDAERDGFVIGEGAGMLLLESLEHAQARGAHIYAELAGYGASADAHHVTAPPQDGNGAAAAMQMALAQAGLRPENIEYINAHGTSTPLNDVSETLAIKRVFGAYAYRLPVSSTKSMTGHLLGAAGAVEAVVCVKALQEGMLPPTVNYEIPDPDCDLDYVPNVARHVQIKTAMSNSFGFGGHNACLVFKKC